MAGGSYQSMSKTEAILGGSPSALAAITAQQGGRPLYSSFIVPAGRNANLRQAVASYVRQPVSADRPDVFNSVALSIGRSPLDARWNQVSGAGVGGNAGAFAGSIRGQDVLAKLEAVNGYVNGRVRFVDDRVQFGVADRWQAPSDTLARGRGDCEDFALAKRAMLRAAGVPDKDLYLVVLKDLSRRADHAVLVVRAAGRFLVLDNGTDRIVNSADIEDYKPVLTFAAYGRSLHPWLSPGHAAGDLCRQSDQRSRSSWPRRGLNHRRVRASCRTSCAKPRPWFLRNSGTESALAQRVASGLQDRLQQIAQHTFPAGDDLRVGHHARCDRQPAAGLFEIGFLSVSTITMK